MIITLLLSGLLGLTLIFFGEWLRHKEHITTESSRKIMHIAHALVVAGWPFFLSYKYIIIAELIFLFVVWLAKHYPIFQPLWNIGRQSWGEVFLPAGVIILAIINTPAWLFMAALLHVGLADALAALVGKRVKSYRYKVFGHYKTVAGTFAFIAASAFIVLISLAYLAPNPSTGQIARSLLAIPILTAIAENSSPYGSDNLTIPLVVMAVFALVGFI